jgi:serine O-acetyltransferase
MMKMELNMQELEVYVNRQLTSIFGLHADLSPYLRLTLERVERCFKATVNKYYKNSEGECCFSPFHSGQYSVFLYYLSNTIHQTSDNSSLATKVYYLNKIMHSVDWYYKIELPEYWGVEHPLGSVLGRAKYANGLFIYQGCTVGGNKGKYPELGENVILYANVTVLGNSKIGNNVIISANTYIINQNIPDCCIVFGNSPNLIIKRKDKLYMNKLISECLTF